MAVKQGFRYHWNRFVRLRPVCQRMPAISLSDGVPLTGKIGQKRARRPGEYAESRAKMRARCSSQCIRRITLQVVGCVTLSPAERACVASTTTTTSSLTFRFCVFSGKSRWAINRLSGMRVDRPRGEREDHCGH